MTDMALKPILDNNGKFRLDINITETGIEVDEGLETAVFLSLFSDQRVTDEEKPFFSLSKCGWWADTLAEVEGDQIGSKLWTLARSKTTPTTLEEHIVFVEDCLNWMIEDGVSSKIDVDAAYVERGVICINIDIFRPDGTSEFFEVIWDGQALKG